MTHNKIFRSWYYLRIGWSTYFAFILAAINTLTVTYYLAIERAPILQEIFPSFTNYVVILTIIFIPILIIAGFVHFRRSHAYGSEAEVATESNPYFFRAPPGWSRDVMWPVFLKMTEVMIKISKNEKLNDDELSEMAKLQEKIKSLMEGKSIGNPRKPN